MRIRSETNRSYAWKTKNPWFFLMFTTVLVVNSSKRLSKPRKTTKNNEKLPKPLQRPRRTKNTTIFKLSLKIQEFVVFPRFLQWFWWSRARNHCQNQEKPPKTTKTHCKSQEKQKNHHFQIISQNPGIRGFSQVFTVVLVVKSSKPLLTTKKPHQNSILKDNLKIVFFWLFVFTVVLVVCCSFWWFFLFLQWFSWSRARNHCKNEGKPPKLCFERKFDFFFLVCFLWLLVVFREFYSRFGG